MMGAILFRWLIVFVWRAMPRLIVVDTLAGIVSPINRAGSPCDLHNFMLAAVMFCSSALTVAVSRLNLCDSCQ